MKVKDTGIGFDRGSDFFSLFRAYTNQFWVFCILNDDGSIAGMASLTRFQAKVMVKENWENHWIGYFGDLRLSSQASHEAHKQWREAYAAIVKHIEAPESEEYCEHIITAVFQENLRALQLFKTRLKKVKYHELCSYWNLSIFRPWSLNQIANELQILKIEAEELEKFERPNLSLAALPQKSCFQNFLVTNGIKKLGAQLFDSQMMRTLRVTNMPISLRLGFRILSFFSPLNYSESQEWHIQSLSSLSWNNLNAREEKTIFLLALVKHIFQSAKQPFHMLNLTLMDEALFHSIQKCFPISKETAGWLFEVTSAEKEPSLPKEHLIFEGAFL